jgi:TPR repeat protein
MCRRSGGAEGEIMSRIRDGKILWISGAIVILIVVIGGAFVFFQESEIKGGVFTENNIQKMDRIRGLAAYDRHDYATALRIFQPLAQQGDPKAQADIGLMYHNGKGVTQNFAEAIKWYRQAAEAGNSAAQFNLANMYYAGQGAGQNYAEAIKWFGKAAAQGNADATNNLGAIYARGQGVKQDYAEAAKFYRSAADKGNISAENNLASLYFNGQGFRRDYSQAATWYRKAADQGYASAQKALGAMYANGLGLAKNDSEAVRWFQKAANQGNAEAQYNLGVMYYTGRGVRQDNGQAIQWWSKAASQGYGDASSNLYALLGKPNAEASTRGNATLSPPATSAWTKIDLGSMKNAADQTTTYIDETNIGRAQNVAIVWFMQDMGTYFGPDGREIAGGAPGKEFRSTIFETEYDCSGAQYRSRYYATFSEHMGKGKLIDGGPLHVGDPVYDWQAVPTDMKTGQQIACRTGVLSASPANADQSDARAVAAPDPIPSQPAVVTMADAQSGMWRKIHGYCATATPPYCAEFTKEMIGDLENCVSAESDAVGIFNELKPPIGFPPQMILRNMLQSRSALSADDLSDIINRAGSTHAETSSQFQQEIFRTCLVRVGFV